MFTFDEKKQLVDELRKQWREMWWERIDDRERAEGISDKDYSKLFVEQGTVIIATRKFKAPDFFDIVQRHMMCDFSDVVPPHPSVGGWRKFIRTNLNGQPKRIGRHRRPPPQIRGKNGHQQQKKGGRGWLHFTR